MRIFTIGYEGATVAEFLAALQQADVERVIDVRAVANSRRPGFSKTPLRGALAGAGIDYVHLRAGRRPEPVAATISFESMRGNSSFRKRWPKRHGCSTLPPRNPAPFFVTSATPWPAIELYSSTRSPPVARSFISSRSQPRSGIASSTWPTMPAFPAA